MSREKVPTLDRSDLAPASGVERGAYVLWDSADSPDLILIGTGAQLGLALEAGRKLAVDGTAVRVVSMPCWELFEAQPDTYRDEVLPPDVGARLSVEAGVALGWSKWVGDRGDSISIEHFGASAPGQIVLDKFGYNVDNVVARATALLARVP
jgi:transketolase